MVVDVVVVEVSDVVDVVEVVSLVVVVSDTVVVVVIADVVVVVVVVDVDVVVTSEPSAFQIALKAIPSPGAAPLMVYCSPG